MPRDRHARVKPQVAAGRRAAAEAIAAGRAEELLLVDGGDSPGLREVAEAARHAGLGVRHTSRAELDRIAADHRGIVATLRDVAPSPLGERELASFAFTEDAVAVVLDGVTDPQNLGAAARSCEAAGVAILVTRIRRAAGPTPAAIRASSGALLHLPQARVANIPRAIARLQDAGFTVAGLDDAADLSIYDEPCPPGRVALVIGSEGEGMSRLVRERCDLLVSLPMRGRVASLNASASVAAALYGWVLANRGR
jgi:23S rRNA (guanosine2251-2'-O)-methyltransferase